MSTFADRAHTRFGTIPTPYPNAVNLLCVYDSATDLQKQRGANWYRNEHDYGRALADTHWRDGSPRRTMHALGIMAALSPMVPWDYAKQLALQCYRERGLRGGHFGQFVDKANLIYEGADPRDILGGPKVRAFYEALGTSGADPDVVVIDRHALHAAAGDTKTPQQRTAILRKTASIDGYNDVANAFRRATEVVNSDAELELTPSQFQAIIWVTWRDWLLGEGD